MADHYANSFKGIEYVSSSEEEFDEFDISTEQTPDPLMLESAPGVDLPLKSSIETLHENPSEITSHRSVLGEEMFLAGMSAMNDLLEHSLSPSTLTEYKVLNNF